MRRRPALLAASIWIAPAVLAMVQQVLQGRLEGAPPPPLRDLLFSGGDWLVYAALTPPIFFLVRRWPVTGARAGRRSALHLGCALLFCVAWAVCGKLLQLMIGLFVDRRALEQGLAFRDWIGWILVTLPFGVVVYVCVAGMAHAIQYFTEVTEREVQLARLSEQLSGARFAALQAQVNPHFLFNTLNTIADLISTNPEQAERMTERLAECFRYALAKHSKDLSTLDEELAFARHYLEIEQVRFGDRLRVQLSRGDAAGSEPIPSLLLQPLLENAIRHGLAPVREGGCVSVQAHREGERLHLSIEDDGVGLRADLRAGVGLRNVQERLRALYAQAAEFLIGERPGGGTTIKIVIPLHVH